MSATKNLDAYVTRRLRIAGGKFIAGRTFDEVMESLRQVYLKPIDALQAELLSSLGRFVSFANYDYVGLGTDPRVRKAAAEAAMEWGVGAEASRLVGGGRTIHDLLEREIAAFLGVEDAMTMVSGYMTNASLIGHILTKNDLILVDELSHNSIIVGTETSHARIVRFAHNDLDHLERLLIEHRHLSKRALIVVEGLYSMDGDIPDLRRLLEFRNVYDAWLMVDEAHSIGVLGSGGRGISEYFGTDASEIDLIIGTLSKTFAGSGGFIAGRKHVIEWLRFTLPAFVYSVGLSPVIVAGVREGLAILQSEAWRTERLRENSRFFLREAQARGLNTGAAIGAGVICIQFRSAEECLHAAELLLNAGYYAPPIAQIGVPKDRPRIRFFISASHEREDLVGALDCLEKLRAPRQRAESLLHLGQESAPGPAFPG